MRYHIAMIFFGCIFTTLKADAFTRIPASVCMLLFNMQMIVGVAVQFFVFGKRYSSSQLAGVALVTAGIAWANSASKQSGAPESSMWSPRDCQIGVVEVLAASVSLALLNITIKSSFSRFGERVDEQVFIQHLFSLLLVFPSQWSRIGPRFVDWVERRDMWLFANLILCVILNVVARAASVQMAGRSPNLLLTQLVQTLESFLQLLTAACLFVPPWPTRGFWGGAVVLALGTLQYLRASEVPSGQYVQGES